MCNLVNEFSSYIIDNRDYYQKCFMPAPLFLCPFLLLLTLNSISMERCVLNLVTSTR